MKEISIIVLFKKKSIRISFLILCGLLIYGNALSRQCWNEHYFDVVHNLAENTIEIRFKFFDYDFGPAGENGFLSECEFSYSTKGYKYTPFMKVITKDQRQIGNWTWLTMTNKLQGALIQFGKCFNPGPGTMWPENKDCRIELTNEPGGDVACFNIIWHLSDRFQEVAYIHLWGVWHVNGLYMNDWIDHFFTINKFIISESKTPVTVDSIQNKIQMPVVDQPENNEAKISKNDDAIVIKGTVPGQNIKVYTTSGALVNSIIANDDLVKIPLTTKQIYIVQIGQKHYKVSL